MNSTKTSLVGGVVEDVSKVHLILVSAWLASV